MKPNFKHIDCDQKTADSHLDLSGCSLEFLKYVDQRPGSFVLSNYDSLDLNNELFQLQPWPTFINQRAKKEIAIASEQVFGLVKRLPERFFGGDRERMQSYYNYSPALLDSLLEGYRDDRMDDLLARGDFILADSGWKCLEYNVSAHLGGWQVPMWEALYLKHPVIDGFIKERDLELKQKNLLTALMEHSIDSVFRKHNGKIDVVNVALTLEDEAIRESNYLRLYVNNLFQQILLAKYPGVRGEFICCTFNHLDLVDDCLMYKDKRVDLMIELYHGAVPPEVVKAFKAGNVILFNGPVTGLISNKLNLAILSEHKDSGIFSDEEREIIEKYIPWTRKVKRGTVDYHGSQVELIDFMIENKDRMVIKSGDGLGGKEVVIGHNTDADQWKQDVDEALNFGNWLVQEFHESVPYIYQFGENGTAVHDAVWGFFILGREYAGGWLRVLPKVHNKGVVNCHQGARVSIIWEVEE